MMFRDNETFQERGWFLTEAENVFFPSET
jgi:hypothetical protein